MKLKRLTASFLIVVLCFLMLPVQSLAASTVASGTCGADLTWTLDDTGTLTISGTGAMKNFSVYAPWSDHEDSIVNVVIEDGVTTIGNWAFQSYQNLTSVVVPATLTKIGDFAFDFCEKLERIDIPANVTQIGKEAFGFCYGLKGVYITDLAAWMQIEYADEYGNPLRWGGENKLYLNGELLKEVTVPEGIAKISRYTLSSSGIEKIILPESVTSIGDYAFSGCTNLVEIRIPESVTSIGKYAFYQCDALESIALPNGLTRISEGTFLNCDKLTNIFIPDSVTQIDYRAFSACNSLEEITLPKGLTRISNYLFGGCRSLSRITIPAGVTHIDDEAFSYCMRLSEITIPSSVTAIGKNASDFCISLSTVNYNGTAAEWENLLKQIDPSNEDLLEAKININGNPMVVYSDASKLEIELGESITLSAGMWDGNAMMGDPSGITFQISNNGLVKVVDTGVSDNCVYLQLEGVLEGITYVTFSDSGTGRAVSVPIKIVKGSYDTYTLETVPEFTMKIGPIVEGPVNFYNHNGLYVDSFESKVSGLGVASVSFDVYNTNHTYGIVEVYDGNGDLYNAVLIDKMDYLNDGIKKVLWDGTACAIRDLFSGNILTYKQETNFSKRTSVSIQIPKNGYIRITASSMQSDILAVVNGADLWMSSLAAVKKVNDFDGDFAFAEDLAKQLRTDENYKDLLKGGKKLCKEIMKGLRKDTLITSKTVGDFATTLYKNLTELNLVDIILSSAKKTGIGIAEETIKEVMGVFGDALDVVFIIGEIEDLVCQYISFVGTDAGGFILIQNQGGGKRHCDNIVLESNVDFDPETALQVFSVEADDELMELVKNADQETYQMLTAAVMHTYDISLVKNGESVQPDGDVMVYIPIPEGLRSLSLSGNVKVYRIEEDGSLTDMDAVILNGCMVFTTNHFSLYTLVGYDPGHSGQEYLPGDINGDGRVNIVDVATLYAHVGGTNILTDASWLKRCDISGDDKVNVLDVAKVYAHVRKTSMLW